MLKVRITLIKLIFQLLSYILVTTQARDKVTSIDPESVEDIAASWRKTMNLDGQAGEDEEDFADDQDLLEMAGNLHDADDLVETVVDDPGLKFILQEKMGDSSDPEVAKLKEIRQDYEKRTLNKQEFTTKVQETIFEKYRKYGVTGGFKPRSGRDQRDHDGRNLHQWEGPDTIKPDTLNYYQWEHDWKTEHIDTQCPDSEMYVRYIKSKGKARIRILDLEVRASDRTLFLFGDYLDDDAGYYDIDNTRSLDNRRADCWMARADMFGQIQRTVFWRTRDEILDDSRRDLINTLPNGFVDFGIGGNYCKSFTVQKINDKNELVGIGTKWREGKAGTQAVIIFRTNAEMDNHNVRIWSDSGGNIGGSYPQWAGDVDMSEDGTIFITGHQTGWDIDTNPASNMCFVLKVNLQLTLKWAFIFGSDRDEQCQQIQVTRAGDYIYVGGVVAQAGRFYYGFWQFPSNMRYIYKFNLLQAPNTATSLTLRRLILNNRATMVRDNTPNLRPEDLKAANRFYICGWYDVSTNAAAPDHQFIFGTLFQDLSVEALNKYGSPGLEFGGDCAITPDNTYFVGGFATKHTHPKVGTNINGQVEPPNCLTKAYQTIDDYYFAYKYGHYSWTHCAHYEYDFTYSTTCGGQETRPNGGRMANREQAATYGEFLQAENIGPYNGGQFHAHYANEFFRRAVWEGWPDHDGGATYMKSPDYPWEEFSFCIARDCLYDQRKCQTWPCDCGVSSLPYCDPASPDYWASNTQPGCDNNSYFCSNHDPITGICLARQRFQTVPMGYAAYMVENPDWGTSAQCSNTGPIGTTFLGCLHASCPDVNPCNCDNITGNQNRCFGWKGTTACDAGGGWCEHLEGEMLQCGGDIAGERRWEITDDMNLLYTDFTWDDCQENWKTNTNNGNGWGSFSNRDLARQYNPHCNFYRNNYRLGKLGHTIWWEFEQDCDNMIDDDAEHYDWFVFKQPTSKLILTDANVAIRDNFPEDAVYFGFHREGGAHTNINPRQVGDGNAGQADEIIHVLQVDEYGFIYIGGHTTSDRFGGASDREENALYAKTHWGLTWELRDDWCEQGFDLCKDDETGDDFDFNAGVGNSDSRDCCCDWWYGYAPLDLFYGFCVRENYGSNNGLGNVGIGAVGNAYSWSYDSDCGLADVGGGCPTGRCHHRYNGNNGNGDDQTQTTAGCPDAESTYTFNMLCHMGNRWTRPMKFMNSHLVSVNANGPGGTAFNFDFSTYVFTENQLGVWPETHYLGNTGHDYYEQLCFPLNEHIDDVADDPEVVGPVENVNDPNRISWLDVDDSVYYFAQNTVEGTGYDHDKDKTDGYQGQNNEYYSYEYLNDYRHWDDSDRENVLSKNAQYSILTTAEGDMAVEFTNDKASGVAIEADMWVVLYSEAGSAYSITDFRLVKNEPFSEQLPEYCTDARFNHKQYLQDDMVSQGFRKTSFHQLTAYEAQHDGTPQEGDWAYDMGETDMEWYVSAPPITYNDDMTLAEGIYYVNKYGAHDINDELFEGSDQTTGAPAVGPPTTGIVYTPIVEDKGSYDCKYEWYAWWHDNYSGPTTDIETNWIQSRNRRQQFSRQKYIVDDPAIQPVRIIGDVPDFYPTKGQTLEYQYDFNKVFEPYDDDAGCYTLSLLRNDNDLTAAGAYGRQIPDWVVFHEGNSTISMQYELKNHPDWQFDLEFHCCNKFEECAVVTFAIFPQNPPPTRKRITAKFHVQYDSTRDVMEYFEWVNTIDQYEELNTPDKSSGLTTANGYLGIKNDQYGTSDHYNTMYMKNNENGNGWYGVEIIGQYYAQLTPAHAGLINTFEYWFGDQWDLGCDWDWQTEKLGPDADGTGADNDCLDDSLVIYVNNIPTELGTFPAAFDDVDPYWYKTDEFDDVFRYINNMEDDWDQGEKFELDLSQYCQDLDTGAPINDRIHYSITYSDGTDLPDWMQFNPVTGVIYGISTHEIAPEYMNIKFTCFDDYGASVTFIRPLLINSPPRVTQKRVIFTTWKDLKFAESIAPYFYDLDHNDFLRTEITQQADIDTLTDLNVNYHHLSMVFGGRPRYTGTFGWFTVTATDAHGYSVDLEVKIIVDDQRPQVTLKNNEYDEVTVYITEGLRYFFFLPDPLLYMRDYSTLTYLLSQPDNSELPDWVNFNPQTLEFSGFAPTPREQKVKIVGMDPLSTNHSKVIVTIIVLPNNNPKVHLDFWPDDVYIFYNNTRAYNYGTWWEWTVHPDLFWDPQNENWEPRTHCEQSNSQDLPEWLKYNARNHTVYGWANEEGMWSIDCTFYDDQGLSIYANFRVTVAKADFDWIPFLLVLLTTVASFTAFMVYLFYMCEYHYRSINRPRLKRREAKLKVVRAIEDRFDKYRDVELKFYLPDPSDQHVIDNHEPPVERHEYNFNESDEEDYFDRVWMLQDRHNGEENYHLGEPPAS